MSDETPLNVSPQIDDCYKLLKMKIDWKDLVTTVIAAAKEIEQMTHLNGEAKLALLHNTLLYALLMDESLPMARKMEIRDFLTNVMPIVVKAIILASKSPVMLRTIDAIDDATCNCLPTLWRKK